THERWTIWLCSDRYRQAASGPRAVEPKLSAERGRRGIQSGWRAPRQVELVKIGQSYNLGFTPLASASSGVTPLKHHPTRAGADEQIAIPGGLSGIHHQRAVWGDG